MTAWHVDRLYNKENQPYYATFPYNWKGTLKIHFGFSLKGGWDFSFIPWYLRYTNFIEWLWYTRFSERSADKLRDKLNKKLNKELSKENKGDKKWYEK